MATERREISADVVDAVSRELALMTKKLRRRGSSVHNLGRFSQPAGDLIPYEAIVEPYRGAFEIWSLSSVAAAESPPDVPLTDRLSQPPRNTGQYVGIWKDGAVSQELRADPGNSRRRRPELEHCSCCAFPDRNVVKWQWWSNAAGCNAGAPTWRSSDKISPAPTTLQPDPIIPPENAELLNDVTTNRNISAQQRAPRKDGTVIAVRVGCERRAGFSGVSMTNAGQAMTSAVRRDWSKSLDGSKPAKAVHRSLG
ncbi:hypothetical protein QBC34DRAFT_425402 [Podospora aff. communis PSN243]|uniref:Uncharacterized protein n=1 Tax=Podospora aff. communis PSN243 TaxID=3040156 RepID=A0AAV9GN55_9PEZI|nr:hypothetical protein QBC34DRAFT_425402 [Podospora aff. communis PSN243]